MLVMMVGLLGLLQALNFSLDHEMRTKLREEAVQLAERRMNGWLLVGFGNLTARHPDLERKVIRGVGKEFKVNRNWTSVRTAAGDRVMSKKLKLEVGWRYKNYSTSHQLYTLRSRGEHE